MYIIRYSCTQYIVTRYVEHQDKWPITCDYMSHDSYIVTAISVTVSGDNTDRYSVDGLWHMYIANLALFWPVTPFTLLILFKAILVLRDSQITRQPCVSGGAFVHVDPQVGVLYML